MAISTINTPIKSTTVTGRTGANHGELISTIPSTNTVIGVNYVQDINALIIPYTVNGYWGFAFRAMTDFSKQNNKNVSMTVYYI